MQRYQCTAQLCVCLCACDVPCAMQGLAQELRRRLGLDLFNFDLLHPSPNQPGALCFCSSHLLTVLSAMQERSGGHVAKVMMLLTRALCCGVQAVCPSARTTW